ncbi:uncharacterized protein LOC128724970 [Anopheles nili]|uniref:uncharacterized protein LOC128724970 n=1 Tax=Anopheles nili TaxID=185578 RepID=UPI00237C07B9|nr:uncharacterized protein LOC128724970 [Anopheles nili]
MEHPAKLDAKKIISDYIASSSHPLPTDAPFNERERLAELKKQVSLNRDWCDDLRRLSSGLYALQLGTQCAIKNNSFSQQITEDLNATIRNMVDKSQEADFTRDKRWLEHAVRRKSKQILVDHMELQKLQGVKRMQEQLRLKLTSSRIMKQLEREQATLRCEQNAMADLEAAVNDIIQRHQEVKERKFREIAEVAVQIGDGQVQLQELRSKLLQVSEQRHGELHHGQGDKSDACTEDGNMDRGLTSQSASDEPTTPNIEPIDWNIGGVNIDLRLDMHFKNPNDFPDILTRLDSITNSNSSAQKVPLSTCNKKNTLGKRTLADDPQNSPDTEVQDVVVETPPKETSVSKKHKLTSAVQKKSPRDHSKENTPSAPTESCVGAFPPVGEYLEETKPRSKKRTYKQTEEKTPSPSSTGSQRVLRKHAGSMSLQTVVASRDEDLMDVDKEVDGELDSSKSENSLDFAMQSLSNEFDMNMSGGFNCSPGVPEEELDFLNPSPRNGKGTEQDNAEAGDGMDSFDFAFGGTHSTENIEQEDDFL